MATKRVTRRKAGTSVVEIDDGGIVEQVAIPTENEDTPEMGIPLGADWAAAIEKMPTAEDVANELKRGGVHEWADLQNTSAVMGALNRTIGIVYKQLAAAAKRHRTEV